MGNQDFLVVLIDRDFLKFGRLLAADAPSGTQAHNVAGLAEIADAIDLAVVDGKNAVHPEIPVRLIFAFQSDFIISKPLVFERPEDIFVTAGQRNLFFSGLHHRSGTLDKQKLPLQSLLGILRVRRTSPWDGNPQRHCARKQKDEPATAQSRRHRFPSVS